MDFLTILSEGAPVLVSLKYFTISVSSRRGLNPIFVLVVFESSLLLVSSSKFVF